MNLRPVLARLRSRHLVYASVAGAIVVAAIATFLATRSSPAFGVTASGECGVQQARVAYKILEKEETKVIGAFGLGVALQHPGDVRKALAALDRAEKRLKKHNSVPACAQPATDALLGVIDATRI